MAINRGESGGPDHEVHTPPGRCTPEDMKVNQAWAIVSVGFRRHIDWNYGNWREDAQMSCGLPHWHGGAGVAERGKVGFVDVRVIQTVGQEDP